MAGMAGMVKQVNLGTMAGMEHGQMVNLGTVCGKANLGPWLEWSRAKQVNL